MFNGIGLATPRGSGTNGYVVRNLSHIRPRDDSYQRGPENYADLKGPRMREYDEGILEHERQRKVEVKCLELQLELEEKEVPEDEIEAQVSALRARLVSELASKPLKAPSGKSLKASDTHGLAMAKKAELERMASALGTTSYQEGDAFNREKQEQRKQERMAERAEREKEREALREAREAARRAEKERAEEEARLRRQGPLDGRLHPEAAGVVPYRRVGLPVDPLHRPLDVVRPARGPEGDDHLVVRDRLGSPCVMRIVMAHAGLVLPLVVETLAHRHPVVQGAIVEAIHAPSPRLGEVLLHAVILALALRCGQSLVRRHVLCRHLVGMLEANLHRPGGAWTLIRGA